MKKTMRKWISILLILITSNVVAQQLVTDPLAVGADLASSETLKSQQKKTNNLLSKIHVAQQTLQVQMNKAQEVQNKIYKGLSEVNSALTDAFIVKSIYNNVKRTLENIKEVTNEASRDPRYAIFIADEAKLFKTRCTTMTTDLIQTLTGGEFNLMSSGQRRTVLRDIDLETKLLVSHSYLMLLAMRRAKMNGFWNSLLPFQRWVNKDVRVARDVINRSKWL